LYENQMYLTISKTIVAISRNALYEASYLAFEGENLLEEALAFTRMHLKDLKGDVSKSMAEQISHTLEVPLHRGMLRLEARWYIEAYNKREDEILFYLNLQSWILT